MRPLSIGITLCLVSWGLSPSQVPETPTTPRVPSPSRTPEPARAPARVEAQLPALIPVDEVGLQQEIEKARGKVLVLHLFQVAGPTTAKELAELAGIQRDYSKSVTVLSVSGDLLTRPDSPEHRAEMQQVLGRAGVDWRTLLYVGVPRDNLFLPFGITSGLPATLIFSPQGQPWASYHRAIRRQDIEDTLEVNFHPAR